MGAEADTFLPGALPLDTSHVLQCPASALPFLQELRSRHPVNENDPFKKLPEVQTPSSEHATRSTVADVKMECVASEPERGLTENLADTYVSSGSACVDFLFHVLPLTERDDAQRRLAAAWAEDPATALRLVMQLRALVRLALAVEGADRMEYGAVAWNGANKGNKMMKKRDWNGSRKQKRREKRVDDVVEDETVAWNGKKKGKKLMKKRGGNGSRGGKGGGEKQKSREKRVAENRRQMAEESERAAVVRKEALARRAAAVVHAYETSERLRAVHNAVAAIFAAALKADLETMRAFEEGRARKTGEGVKEESGGKGKKKRKWMGMPAPKLSLAAKWAPSPGKSFDHCTLLTSSIALHLFPPSSSSPSSAAAAAAATESEMDADGGAAAGGGGGYVRVAKERLQREVLAPLRRALEVPEVHMSRGRWEHVAYGRVPSVCMKNTRKRFLSHDEARFKKYLEDVKGGEAKIASGALLPHEVVKTAMAAAGDRVDTVGELQWKAMVADVRSKGSLGNSMAVCDVSGSMEGIPMEVAIALSLLVSEVSSEPWKNHLITFSAQPRIHHVQGETLVERVSSTQGMAWGYNTNFQAVFDLLLSRAQQFELDPADMVQRLYVFSDMQFDEARGPSGGIRGRDCGWETDHQAIVRKYTAAGYPVPQIVYWNLRGDASASSTPVAASEEGVALVSGFSKGMLLTVLEGKELSPMTVLEEAIKGKLFELVQVVD
ncbi:unnamed protein product [Closterium sp. Naga37s-1]|nr:unnamed protein product [Closterium sp. Naga37s-1]